LKELFSSDKDSYWKMNVKTNENWA